MVNQSTSFPSGLRHPMFDWDKQQTDSRATTKIRVFLSYISCNIIKWILISQIYGNWVKVINSLNALGLCPLKLHLGMGFRNNRKILLFPPVFLYFCSNRRNKHSHCQERRPIWRGLNLVSTEFHQQLRFIGCFQLYNDQHSRVGKVWGFQRSQWQSKTKQDL